MENKTEENLNDLLLLLAIIQDCDRCREKFLEAQGHLDNGLQASL